MKKKIFISMLAAAAAFITAASVPAEVSAITSETEILDPYSVYVRQDCMAVGVKGSYFADIDAAITRINEIRLEACREGVRNPSDPSRNLTLNDYVPIKWSHELEQNARLRAAEAAVCPDHTRPDGQSCMDVNTNALYTRSEVLARNYSDSLVDGINQFYEEKLYWVNGMIGTAGHYTAMIDPYNTYVGMAGFKSDCGAYDCTVCGRFGTSGYNVSETKGKESDECVVPVEILKDLVSSPYIKSVSDKNVIELGEKEEFELRVKINYKGEKSNALIYKDVEWTSSDTSVAETDSFGTVSAKSPGTVTISAVSGDYSASMKIRVECSHSYKSEVVKPTYKSGGYTIHTCTKCGRSYKDTYTDRLINYELSAKNIKLSFTSCEYDGSHHKPQVTVTNGYDKLKNGRDYKILYSNNVKAGTASVTITGAGKYKGSVTKKFRITPLRISEASIIVSSANHKYTGKKIEPGLKLVYNDRTLKKGTDYTVTFSNNVNVGKAYITVKGKGNYTGTKKAYFNIVSSG